MKCFAVAVLSLCLVAPASVSQAATGQDLIDWCAGYPDSEKPNLCAGYVRETVNLLNKGEVIDGMVACVPDDVPNATVIETAYDWLSRHPERLDMRFGEAIMPSLAATYPCPN